MFHCFPLATYSPSFISSILVLLCPMFFVCNAMIVGQEPFYTKWLELVLFFPRGRERATVRFFIVSFSSPFSLFSLLSLYLSLSLSPSLCSLVCRRTKKRKKKKKVYNAVERKEKLIIAWPTRWPTRIHSVTRASGNTIQNRYIPFSSFPFRKFSFYLNISSYTLIILLAGFKFQ